MKMEIKTRLNLSARDAEIITLLAQRVPLLSLSQVASAFYGGDSANAARSLARLTKRGLLSVHSLVARTPPEVVHPLASWNPGEDQPSPTRLAFLLNKRWLKQGIRLRQCYLPGVKLQAVSGLTLQTRPRRVVQASHELGLAELYLHFRVTRPALANCWIGEHSIVNAKNPALHKLFPAKSQQPDAVLVDQQGNVFRVVEYGGVYNAKRIDRFHRWCQQRSLPYEIW